MELNDTLKARLLDLLAAASPAESGKPDLEQVVFHHEGANLIGHVLLDLLEEHGFLPEDIDVMVGGDTISAAICLAISSAAYSRGLDIDTWVISNGQRLGPKLAAPTAILVQGEIETGDIQPLVAAVQEQGGQVLASLSLWGAPHRGQEETTGLLHLVALSEANLS